MPKVIYATIINNELDMLDLSLSTLYDAVDEFVVVEADKTHSGRYKPFQVSNNLSRFDAYNDKLTVVAVSLDEDHHDWTREREHRADIATGLNYAYVNTGDWIVVGDLDEIPDPAVLNALRELPDDVLAVKFEAQMFYYSLQYRVREGWALGAHRYFEGIDPNAIRACSITEPVTFVDAAVHLSYFMTPAGVVDKLNSFMHDKDVARDVPRDAEWIADKMRHGQDLYGRTIKIDYVPDTSDLPEFITSKVDQFSWLMGWE